MQSSISTNASLLRRPDHIHASVTACIAAAPPALFDVPIAGQAA